MNTTNAQSDALRALPRWSDDREDMHPAPDGPWLRYDDVAAMLAALASSPAPGEADTRDALRWRFVCDDGAGDVCFSDGTVLKLGNGDWKEIYDPQIDAAIAATSTAAPPDLFGAMGLPALPAFPTPQERQEAQGAE